MAYSGAARAVRRIAASAWTAAAVSAVILTAGAKMPVMAEERPAAKTAAVSTAKAGKTVRIAKKKAKIHISDGRTVRIYLDEAPETPEDQACGTDVRQSCICSWD